MTMTETEALTRMGQNDRSFAAHRAELAKRETSAAIATTGRAPGDPRPLSELLLVPPEFDREPTVEERQRKVDEEVIKRRSVEKSIAVVPPKLRGVLVNGYQVEESALIDLVLRWERENRFRVLLLLGPVGVGKSLAAAVAMHACAERGRRSLSWHRPNDFVSAVLHSYDPHAPKLGTDLVVIDDVGRETKADFEESVNAFLDETDTRLVMTTNLKPPEFRTRYDERLLDRLRECCLSENVKGKSRRTGGGGF